MSGAPPGVDRVLLLASALATVVVSAVVVRSGDAMVTATEPTLPMSSTASGAEPGEVPAASSAPRFSASPPSWGSVGSSTGRRGQAADEPAAGRPRGEQPVDSPRSQSPRRDSDAAGVADGVPDGAADGMAGPPTLAGSVEPDELERIARSVRRTQPLDEVAPAGTSPAGSPTTADFRVGSLNVLGSSHTVAHGNKPRYASGATRMRWSMSLVRAAGLDVVGLQEFQGSQLAAFRRLTQGSWSVFPGTSRGRKLVQNSIVFRTDVWDLEQASLVTVPYFRGHPFPMPYVLLRHRDSGHRVWFVNVHNPANTHGDATAIRARGIAIESALVNRLHADGTPVVFTGDFNARGEAFCPLVGRTALQAANGGSAPSGSPGGSPGGSASGCRLPANSGIDWVFATSGVTASGYVRDRSALVRRATDHPFVHAGLSFTGVPDGG